MFHFEFGASETERQLAQSGPQGEILPSLSGQPMRDLVTAIEKQPGFEFWISAVAEEEKHANKFYLFVGWQRFPPSQFLDSQALEPGSKLFTLLGPALLHATQLLHVPFDPPFLKPVRQRFPRPIELITWTIPPCLDPTVYHSHAETFTSIDFMLSHLDDYSGCAGPGDLIACERSWVIQANENMEEPSEKTHIFLLFWKDAECERRFKDPDERTFRYGSGGRRSSTEPNDIWERQFLDLQREWTRHGLKATSVHLTFIHDTI